MSVEQVDSW